MALDHATTGGVVLAASAVSVFGGGWMGANMGDYALATIFVSIGCLGKVALDAKDDLDNKTVRDRGYYLSSLGYAILAAPMLGAITLAAVRQAGFIPDFFAAPCLMAMGYGGRPLFNWLLAALKSKIPGASNKGGPE